MPKVKSFDKYVEEQLLNKFKVGSDAFNIIKLNPRAMYCLQICYIYDVSLTPSPFAGNMDMKFDLKKRRLVTDIGMWEQGSAIDLVLILVHETFHFMNRIGKDLSKLSGSQITQFMLKEEANCFYKQFLTAQELSKNSGMVSHWFGVPSSFNGKVTLKNCVDHVNRPMFNGVNSFSYPENYSSDRFVTLTLNLFRHKLDAVD